MKAVLAVLAIVVVLVVLPLTGLEPSSELGWPIDPGLGAFGAG